MKKTISYITCFISFAIFLFLCAVIYTEYKKDDNGIIILPGISDAVIIKGECLTINYNISDTHLAIVLSEFERLRKQ